MEKIAVILGSQSDKLQVEDGLKLLGQLGISYDLKILSAHRDPDRLRQHVKSFQKKGIKLVIACAGLSAALPGVVSSYVDIPVIGVPLYSKAFKGVDSLLSVLQMPKGVPVATVTVGSSGMINAAILAARILSLNNKEVKSKLMVYKRRNSKKK